MKVFTEAQSWDLLMKLLGPDWQDRDRLGQMKSSEDRAARQLLNSLGGVSLSCLFLLQNRDCCHFLTCIKACFGDPTGCAADCKPRNWWTDNRFYLRVIQEPHAKTARETVWGSPGNHQSSRHFVEHDIQLVISECA